MPLLHSFAISLYQIGAPLVLAGYSRPDNQFSESILAFEILVVHSCTFCDVG